MDIMAWTAEHKTKSITQFIIPSIVENIGVFLDDFRNRMNDGNFRS